MVWSPWLGPVSSDGVCPDRRDQSKSSFKDCCQLHKSESNVHPIPWKENLANRNGLLFVFKCYWTVVSYLRKPITCTLMACFIVSTAVKNTTNFVVQKKTFLKLKFVVFLWLICQWTSCRTIQGVIELLIEIRVRPAILKFIKSILKSLVILAMWLTLSGAIYSRTIFCSKSHLFLSQWE